MCTQPNLILFFIQAVSASKQLHASPGHPASLCYRKNYQFKKVARLKLSDNSMVNSK
jgi:hypothetical protein